MTDSKRAVQTRRLLDHLEALQVLCKQIDHHAGELAKTIGEELKSGAVYDTGKTSEP
jgi:hypothetical protein